MPLWSHSREIGSARVLAFYHYWQGLLRPGEIAPLRARIDPTAITELLPYLVIADFTPDPLHVRYRLVGTRVVEMSRWDYTGKSLAECDFQAEEPGIWRNAYAQIAATSAPVFGRVHIPYNRAASRPAVWEEFVILPLSQDGQTLHQCIALEDYAPHANDTAPDQLRPMRPASPLTE